MADCDVFGDKILISDSVNSFRRLLTSQIGGSSQAIQRSPEGQAKSLLGPGVGRFGRCD